MQSTDSTKQRNLVCSYQVKFIEQNTNLQSSSLPVLLAFVLLITFVLIVFVLLIVAGVYQRHFGQRVFFQFLQGIMMLDVNIF